MMYIGLTDDPDAKRIEHGNPPDWSQRAFETQPEALEWKRNELWDRGYLSGPLTAEWRFGYTYTITAQTVQPINASRFRLGTPTKPRRPDSGKVPS